MAERPDPKDYVYCDKHDIFFKKAPKEINLGSCPLCLQDIFGKKYDPQRTLFEGSKDLSKTG